MSKIIDHRRFGQPSPAEKLNNLLNPHKFVRNLVIAFTLAFFLFMNSRVQAVDDITNVNTDLYAIYGMSPSLGVTNWLTNTAIDNVIVTNYDYTVFNTNSKTNTLAFGATNWYQIMLTNSGGLLSKPDFYKFTNILTGTNDAGYGFTNLLDFGTVGIRDASDIAIGVGIALSHNTNIPLLIGLWAPQSGTNERVVTLKVIAEATQSIRSGNDGRMTNVIVAKSMLPKASSFRIVHDGVSLVSNWAQVDISVLDSISNVIGNYRGTITVEVEGGTSGNVFWSINTGNNGLFTDLFPNGASYKFDASDSGLVSLFVKDTSVESLLIRVRGDGVTSQATNWLYFDKLQPYIVSMTPPDNGYGTLVQITNLQIMFSKQMDLSTLTTNNIKVYKYSEDGSPSPVTISMMDTNTGGKGALIRLSGITESDILTKFEVRMNTNVRSLLGYGLIPNPHNLAYTAPYTNIIYSMIEKSKGAVIDSNLSGISIPKDIRLIAGVDELAEDAYIRITEPDFTDPEIIEANSKVVKNQYLQFLEDSSVKEIEGFGAAGNSLTELHGVMLELSYSESSPGRVQGMEGEVGEDELNIFWLNEVTGRWEYVGTPVIDKDNDKVSIEIYKYGKYALMGDTTVKNFSESVVVYPNPFDPLKQAMFVRFYVEKGAYISAEVFSQTGEKVIVLADRKYVDGGRVYENALSWDGKNGRGMTVVNGVYIIKVKIQYSDGSGSKQTLYKVAVRK